MFVCVEYKKEGAATDNEIIEVYNHTSFATVRDVLEKVQKKHRASTLIF